MQTKEEFFKYESECKEVFNTFYKTKNWLCKRITGRANKFYDCLLQVDGRELKIEEKARGRDYEDLLVEIEQDTETKNPGWLYYTQADYLFYMVMKKTIYAINMEKLKSHIEQFKDNYNQKISIKGWGRTVNIAIPWHTIFYNKIGARL